MNIYILCMKMCLFHLATSGTLEPKNINVIAAIATPIEKAIISDSFQNCTVVKRTLGIEYDQLVHYQPDISKLTIDLWHPGGKEKFQIHEVKTRLINSTNYNRSLPLSIFIHGFRSTSNSEAVVEVCKALVTHGGVNVLALDSGSLIKFFYYRSSTYVHFIGNELGRILSDFYKDGIQSTDIHLIGHSLGSHIAGFAGKAFQNLTDSKIGRITGLDPAGPCFFLESNDSKLKNTDADFVDVIHTDAGVFGIAESLGDADFYPNGGNSQPGCPLPTCSHERSWKLFVESIRNPRAFPAVRCNNGFQFLLGICSRNMRSYMGYGTSYSSRGEYYLKTTGVPQYGLGKSGYIPYRKIFPSVLNI